MVMALNRAPQKFKHERHCGGGRKPERERPPALALFQLFPP